MIENLVDVYVDCISAALPITLVFFFGNLIVSTFLTAAFTGHIKFRA